MQKWTTTLSKRFAIGHWHSLLYLVDVKAHLPTKNTEFDPAKPIAPRKAGKGGDKSDKGNGKGAKKGSNNE